MAAINGVGRFGVRSYVAPTSSLSSIITNGLIVNLDAGNSLSYSGTGTTWTDMSGNGNNVTLFNGTSYSAADSGTMVFDGVNDFAQSNILSMSSSPNLTFNIWAKHISYGVGDTVFMLYGSGGSPTNCLGLYYRANDNYVRFTNWGPNDFSTSFEKDINVWHYWSIVYENGNLTIYRDGDTDGVNFAIPFSGGNRRFGIGATEGGSNVTNINSSMCHFYNRALTQSEIRQNFDATKTRYGYSVTSAATITLIYPLTSRTQAFATATGITSAKILNALHTLDTGLISNGLDVKMKALYPFVGGTSNTHKFNFMDARDLDAAFRLQFNGGWGHSSNGILPNGTNAYANTYLTPSTSLGLYNAHSSIYTKKGGTSGFDLGSSNLNSWSREFLLSANRGGYATSGLYDLYGPGSIQQSVGDVVGFFNNTITSNTSTKLYKNGVSIGSYTGTNTSLPAEFPIWLGGVNASDVGMVEQSSRQLAFASIGSGLTDVEATTFYNLVQAFQTSLSRQV